ncbi:hypothetical protein AAH450_07925 [Erwinia sp. P7711]|uniref:hypothetical protein n=1 Tax=Erwinia sp. P7711 TaxID=3141451 RepID=UPI003186ABA8
MNDTKLPTVAHESEMELLPGLTITVLALDNGQRIIPVEDMQRACEFIGIDLEAFHSYLAGQPARKGGE